MCLLRTNPPGRSSGWTEAIFDRPTVSYSFDTACAPPPNPPNQLISGDLEMISELRMKRFSRTFPSGGRVCESTVWTPQKTSGLTKRIVSLSTRTNTFNLRQNIRPTSGIVEDPEEEPAGRRSEEEVALSHPAFLPSSPFPNQKLLPSPNAEEKRFCSSFFSSSLVHV